MAADLGMLQRLPKIVPQGVAREMAYTGERLGAERALAVGLVNAVLPDAAALLDRAMALARTIAAKSPLAIAGSKLALNHARDHSTASALQQMTLLQSAIFDTGEMATAIAAWKEKRAADVRVARQGRAGLGQGPSGRRRLVQPPPSTRYSVTAFCSCSGLRLHQRLLRDEQRALRIERLEVAGRAGAVAQVGEAIGDRQRVGLRRQRAHLLAEASRGRRARRRPRGRRSGSTSRTAPPRSRG